MKSIYHVKNSRRVEDHTMLSSFEVNFTQILLLQHKWHKNLFVTSNSGFCGHSRGEKQKTAETGIAAFIVENPAVLPQLCVHFITLLQWENNTIAAISIGLRLQRKYRALDLIVFMETDCHLGERVSMSIKSEEIDSIHWCCEFTCEIHKHTNLVTVKKCLLLLEYP